MVLYAALAVLALVGFVLTPPAGLRYSVVLVLLVAALLTSTGGMLAILAPYATEIYPTDLRASGRGHSAPPCQGDHGRASRREGVRTVNSGSLNRK
jgi:MFS transporter, putative metabolite:H+ symporter